MFLLDILCLVDITVLVDVVILGIFMFFRVYCDLYMDFFSRGFYSFLGRLRIDFLVYLILGVFNSGNVIFFIIVGCVFIV